MAMMTEEEWEAAGETDQCAQCPSKPLVLGDNGYLVSPCRYLVSPCPFWIKRQPCPVELGIAEVSDGKPGRSV